MAEVFPEIYFTGRFVREYIETHGPSSPYDMWKRLKAIRENRGYEVPSYQTFLPELYLEAKEDWATGEGGGRRKGLHF